MIAFLSQEENFTPTNIIQARRSIYLSSILSCYQLYSHICSASSVRNNSIEVAGLHVTRSTITSLWFYNDSCVRDSFFFKSLVRLKERTRESCFREREVFPSVSLTLVQIRFIVATAVESLAPLRGRTSCVHLFHARWNDRTRREHPSQSARNRRKSRRNIFRCTNRDKF